MYASYQRYLAESAAEEAHQRRVARLQPLHAAHASAAGIACPDVRLVGASWLKQWTCPTCQWTNT